MQAITGGFKGCDNAVFGVQPQGSGLTIRPADLPDSVVRQFLKTPAVWPYQGSDPRNLRWLRLTQSCNL
jgi:hypothetical protein